MSLNAQLEDAVKIIKRQSLVYIATSLGVIVINFYWNIAGIESFIIPTFFFGVAVLLTLLFNPFLLLGSGTTGLLYRFLLDRDKSQGAAAGLAWLAETIIALNYIFTALNFILLTVSFEHSPGSFWVLFIGFILIALAARYKKKNGGKVHTLVIAFAVIMIAGSLYKTLGLYSSDAFDADTGHPNFMVENDGSRKIDTKNRAPADCRPFWEGHEGFDYATKGTCRSTKTGKRLVPNNANDVRKLNRSYFDTGSTVIKKIYNYNPKRNTQVGNNEVVAKAENKQSSVSVEPKAKIYTKTECVKRFSDKKYCERLTMQPGSTYERKAKPSMCIYSTLKKKLKRTPLGDKLYEFKNIANHKIVVYIFDQAIGDIDNNVKCG